MDEVPMSFDMPPNRTIDDVGTKTISIKTTGNERSCFTVVLACSMSGDKLPPLVIFKRKTIPKEDFPVGCHVSCNEKGWMREDVMHKWIDDVLRKRKGSFFNPKCLLIMDSMRAHLMESVKERLKKLAISLAIIPGGMTKHLQPLDISVNRAFKSNVRKHWEAWMQDGSHTYTKTGRMRRATYADVCKWVMESWNAIPCRVVVNGFAKAGLKSSGQELSDAECDSAEDTDDTIIDSQMIDLFCSDSPDSDYDGFVD